MPARLVGRTVTSMTVDDDGQREYKVDFHVRVDAGEGALTAYNCSDLPQDGDDFNIQIDATGQTEHDQWATCKQSCTVSEIITSEPNRDFNVQKTFSTKNNQRCQDHKVEDPLQEPAKISFSTQETKEEATIDMFGDFIENSAHEQMRGPQVEFESSTVEITIEQNVPDATLGYILPIQFTNCVNESELWGLPPRTIRLSRISGELKYYGRCNIYYSRKLTFSTHYLLKTDPNGSQSVENWDRHLLDEGTKVLRGHWEATDNGVKWVLEPVNGIEPDPDNVRDFIQWHNPDGSRGKVILDGTGKPSGSDTSNYTRYICIQNNIGADISETDFWIPLTNNPDDSWDEDKTYNIGDITEFDGELYVAIFGSSGGSPPDPTLWALLPNGLNEDAGVWVPITGDYAVGDVVVQEASGQTTAGSIFVAKYPGVDFSLLGIPLVF